MSRIPDIKNFYEGCFMLSMKTSNNQEVIDRMPFYKYLSLSESLNKYIEMENKANGGESTSDEANKQMDSVKSSSEEMMNKAKSNFKMPSFSKFK